MSNGPAIASLPRAPVTNLYPTLEPHLVEVIVPFVTGTVDEAVRQASAIVDSAVQAAVNKLVGNAPSVLDIFEEIDNAIGNDPNFATTMTTALATKLVKSSNLSDLVDKSAARGNIGLGNVDNTRDADKPVSTDQATAIATRLAKSSNLADLLDATAARKNIGLDKVSNTADADKPVSTAQQAALDKKLTNVQGEFINVFGDLFLVWFQSLPTTAPALSNKWWNNGNTLALTF